MKAAKRSPKRPATFRILFEIAGTTYIVVPVADAHPDVAEKAFRLKKPDGTIYDVRQGADGHVECSCPGHKFQAARGVVCRHVRALRAARML